MNTIKQIQKMLRLHELIKQECTGTPRAMSDKLGIPERTIFWYLEELRDMGAQISFDKIRKTYFYDNEFDIDFKLSININLNNKK